MLKEEIPVGGRETTHTWGRVCDTCRSSPCHVYCSSASRVWMCEACERAPAAFLCKADAASLCAACDADIHSANPLARRHHRVPIVPGGPHRGPADMAVRLFLDDHEEDQEGDEEEEAASWLILNNNNNNSSSSNNNDNNVGSNNHNNNNGFLLEGEVDGYLDLFEYNNHNNSNGNNQGVGVENHHHHHDELCDEEKYNGVQEKSYGGGGDSVVPVQYGEVNHNHNNKELQFQNFLFGMECETKSGYNSYSTSFSHSVSVSSMDVGVVPDSTLSDISLSHPRPPKGTIDLFSSPPMQLPTQLSPMDREARVMRYREKKKTRKFEKTIRYASRKAYAETRPRIKGRFAKRSEVEAEMEQMFPNSLMSDGGYGIVPSF